MAAVFFAHLVHLLHLPDVVQYFQPGGRIIYQYFQPGGPRL